jgi:hypothetical protein
MFMLLSVFLLKTNIETTGGARMESSSIPGNAGLLG